jgi:hypothetical protein
MKWLVIRIIVFINLIVESQFELGSFEIVF